MCVRFFGMGNRAAVPNLQHVRAHENFVAPVDRVFQQPLHRRVNRHLEGREKKRLDDVIDTKRHLSILIRRISVNRAMKLEHTHTHIRAGEPFHEHHVRTKPRRPRKSSSSPQEPESVLLLFFVCWLWSLLNKRSVQTCIGFNRVIWFTVLTGSPLERCVSSQHPLHTSNT